MYFKSNFFKGSTTRKPSLMSKVARGRGQTCTNPRLEKGCMFYSKNVLKKKSNSPFKSLSLSFSR